MPGELADVRGPARHRKELGQQKPLDVRPGNGQPGQQIRDRVEGILRKRGDQLAASTDPEFVEPSAQSRPLPPRLIQRQAQPWAHPAGLPPVEVAGAVPGDIRDDVTGPAGTGPFVHQLRHGPVAAFGTDGRRRLVEQGPAAIHREAGEPLGMLLPALDQGRVEVGWRDLAGAQTLSEPFGARQDVTDPNVGEQLASDEKRTVREAEKRIDRHVVRQGPEWRDDGPDGGQMRRQFLGGQPGRGGCVACHDCGHQRWAGSESHLRDGRRLAVDPAGQTPEGDVEIEAVARVHVKDLHPAEV